jgi:hypothetical protein
MYLFLIGVPTPILYRKPLSPSPAPSAPSQSTSRSTSGQVHESCHCVPQKCAQKLHNIVVLFVIQADNFSAMAEVKENVGVAKNESKPASAYFDPDKHVRNDWHTIHK